MKRDKVLILGASGLLGVPLVKKLLESNFDVISVSRNSKNVDFNIDVLNENEFDTFLDNINPKYIINLVAITSVDNCETNIPLAYKIHVGLCELLTKYSKRSGSRILHISTDHFYEGYLSKESDIYPQNVYALTKLMGENALSNIDSIILRTNFFGKSSTRERESLSDVMFNNAKNGSHLKLFNDVYFSPLSIKTLCGCIVSVLNNWNPGIYNLGSKSGMSKEDFVLCFLNHCQLSDIKYTSLSFDECDFIVKRPKDMRMDCSYFEKTFSIKLPLLSEEIELVAKEYNE